VIILAEETIDFMPNETPIVENPMAAELERLWSKIKSGAQGKIIRFIADAKHKTFYAFDGSNYIHHDAVKNIEDLWPGHVGQRAQAPYIFTGGGVLGRGKIVPDPMQCSAAFMTIAQANKILKHDWSFVDRYLTLSVPDMIRIVMGS
jgi:hypothetical protein